MSCASGSDDRLRAETVKAIFGPERIDDVAEPLEKRA
jgi:hypothetical protein